MNRIASIATAAATAGLSLAVLGTIALEQGVVDVRWPSADALSLHRDDDGHEEHEGYDGREEYEPHEQYEKRPSHDDHDDREHEEHEEHEDDD